MVVVILAMAGYAAYVAAKQQKEHNQDESTTTTSSEPPLLPFDDNRIPPELWQGKTKLLLLPHEASDLALFELSLACMHWFEGDYTSIESFLEQRVREIVMKNPWLGGWLVTENNSNTNNTINNNKVRRIVLYDEKGQETPKGIFQAYEPGVIPLFHNSNYPACTKHLTECGAIVPPGHALINQNRPLFRVSIVPDADQPRGRFALVVSMCHSLGDAVTFYRIIQMMNLLRTTEEQHAAQALLADRDMEFHAQADQVMGFEANQYFTQALTAPPIDMTKDRNEATVMKAFAVSPDWFDTLQQQQSEGYNPYPQTPTNQQNFRRSSVFSNVAKDFDSAVLEQFASEDEDDTDTPSTIMLAATKATPTVSENSILTSWFFKLNEADLAFMGMSLRNRLDGCLVSEFHAGNYVRTIPYAQPHYQTPELIEKSVATLQRCGGNPDNNSLPRFQWNKTASLAINWAHCFQKPLQLGEGIRQINHLPLFDAELVKKVPGRLSMIYMFTVTPAEDDDPDQKRAGVLVLCRTSVWNKILNSGIVEKMLIDS